MKLNLIRTQLLAAAIGITGISLSYATNINVPGDHATIQGAINAATAGDTIIVAAGYYEENLASWKDMEITKSLTLKGAGSGQTVIGLTQGKMNGVEIRGSNLEVTIEGITFTKRTGSDNASSFGLRIAESASNFTSFVLRDVEVAYASGRNVFFGSAGTYSNVVIEDSQFHHAGSWGVTFAGPVDGLVVKNSSFTENGQIDPGQGIGLDFTSPGPHQNILIEDSDFSNNLRRGINALNLQNAVVRNVTANNNGTSGFQIWNWAGNTSNVLFENCIVTGNGQDGVQIAAEPGLSVSGITFDGGTYANNSRNNIRFHNGGGTVEDVTIKNATLGRFTGTPGSAQAVVFVDSVNGITLANNTLTQEEIHWNVWLMNLTAGAVEITGNTFNGTYGVAAWTGVDTSLLDIRENQFLLSGLALYNHENNDPHAADFNYWGSATPDFETQTEGAIEVTFWYTDDTLTTLASSLPVENVDQNTFFSNIQDALNAAMEGDLIRLAAGTHEVPNGLNIPVSVTIAGAGEGDTLVQVSRTSASYGVTTATNTNLELTMRDLTIEAVDNVRFFFFHIAHNKSFTLENVTVIGMGKDYYHDGVESWGNTVGGVDVINLVAATLTNVTVREASRNAISLSAVKNIVMKDFVIEDSGAREGSAAIAIYNRVDYPDNNPESIDIDGGSITGAPIGMNLGDTMLNTVTGDDIQNVAFANNVVQAVASSDEAEALLANNTFDRAVVVRGSPIKVPVIFSSIQAAIDAAGPGDTLEVASGTYVESGQILIDKNLTILGADKDTTIIRPAENIVRWMWIESNVDDFRLANVTLDGDGRIVSSAIRTKGSGVIENNIIRNIDNGTNNSMGIEVHWTGFGQEWIIEGNTFENIGRLGILVDSAEGNALIEGNTFIGKGGGSWVEYGIEVGESAAQIQGNNFTNYRGVANDGSNSAGILVTDFYNPANPPVVGVVGNVFDGNSYGVLVGFGANDSSVVTINENVIRASGIAAVRTSAPTVAATENYWGEPGGPYVNPSLVVGDVTWEPWYADEDLTILVFIPNFQDKLVDGEETLSGPTYIGGGSTWTVTGTLTFNGPLTLEDGSVLEVINGSLVLEDGSVLEGTFTFFNSMGSVEFNSDIEITASATGLILISDVHIAAGATITVDGTLVIDGSVVDCQTPGGPYTIDVQSTASFTMARTVMIDGILNLASDDSKVYNNRFENSMVNVALGTNGARVYHNLTDDLGWLTDSGTGTVTTVDSWGNVIDASDTKNNLALGLDIAHLATDRTQDVDGNVFIKPEDSVFATVDVSALQAKIAGVEVMLGYNTTLIDVATLGLADDWDVLINSVEDDSTAIGLIDAAIGLSFNFGDPAGSEDDQTIGDVELVSGLDEGETLFFHRVKLATDVFGGETRLTTGGASPAYLTPFTSNSSMITIDGTAPLIDVAGATIEQFTEDVNTGTTPSAITIQGNVDIVASAFDALAGIEDASAVVTLVGPETYTATQASALPSTVVGFEDYTTYSFTYTVDETTENGTYNVVFTVTDRSGNQTVETLGSILINKNQVEVDIELQGLVAGPLTRDVELVFTDAGGNVIETRTEAVEFTSGVGSVTLTDVDDASFRLSAKAAWNLRKRLDVGLDANGQALVEFTDVNKLRGGDLNGDNVINTLDYSILRFYWFTTNAVADITGSGNVQMPDFLILQDNFYQTGDPQ